MRLTFALAGLLTLAACSGGDSTQTLTGTFSLEDADGFTGGWTSCRGEGGYSDFGPGMNVTVRDGEGNIVGSGSARSLTESDQPPADFDLNDTESAQALAKISQAAYLANAFPELACYVAFEVEIADAEFYEIEIGRRGGLSYSKAELAADDYEVQLSLGG